MMLLLLGGAVHAADHYVRAGGTGTGADWANALGQLPPTLTRGDTYWVAAGNYPGYTFTTPEAVQAPITVKKATANAHGNGAGWQPAYGEGVAVWGPMTCSVSYVVFDGVTGEGKSGHGFEIFDPAGTSSLFQFQNAPKNVTISHVNMHFKDRLSSSGDAVYGNTPCQEITVSYCYIHDIGRCPVLMRGWQKLLLEHCWIARNHSTPAQHAEGISTHGGGGHVIRHNVWEDIEGTAIIVNLAEPTSNWEIYGNCFFQNPGSGCTGVGHGIVADNFADSGINGLKFYNNSIYGVVGISTGLRFWGTGTAGIVASNNVWYKCQSIGFNQVQHDYNSYYDCTTTFEFAGGAGQHEMAASGDPFAGSASGDFHLKAATAAGTPLGAPYNVDPENKMRGSDGNWDRGAFELGGTPNPAAAAGAGTAMNTTTSSTATSGTQTTAAAAQAGTSGKAGSGQAVAQTGQTASSKAAAQRRPVGTRTQGTSSAGQAPDAVSGATQSSRSGATGALAAPVAASPAAPTATALNAATSRAPDAVSGATQSVQAGASAPVPAYPMPPGMVTPVYSGAPDAVSGATQTAAAGGAPGVNAAAAPGTVPGQAGAPDAVSGATQTASAQQAGDTGSAGGAASAGSGRNRGGRASSRRNARAAKANARHASKNGGTAPAAGAASKAAAPARAERGYIRVVTGGSSESPTSGTGALLGASALPAPKAAGGVSATDVSGAPDAVSGATQTARPGAAAPNAVPASAPAPVAAPISSLPPPPAGGVVPAINAAPVVSAGNPAPVAPAPAMAKPTTTPGARDGGSASGAVVAVSDEAPKPTPTPKPETSAVAVAVRMAAEAHLAEAARATSNTTGGLVAAYGFGSESEEVVVKDLSGKGNDGVAMGAKWSPAGKFGGCMVFNGTSDRITVPDSASLDLSRGMTLEAWICPIGSLSGWRSVMMKEKSQGADYYLYANTQYERPGTSVFVGNEVLQIGGERPALNAWTHLAATYDGTAQRLYVNGREVARRPQRGAIRPSQGLLQIGGNTVWGEYFMGRIDEVRIYNRALTTAEITRDMNTPVKSEAASQPVVKEAGLKK